MLESVDSVSLAVGMESCGASAGNLLRPAPVRWWLAPASLPCWPASFPHLFINDNHLFRLNDCRGLASAWLSLTMHLTQLTNQEPI